MTDQALEKAVEEFKKAIGYTKLGSAPMLPTENSDVIVGAFMVGVASYAKEKLKVREDEIREFALINSHEVKEGKFVWQKDILQAISHTQEEPEDAYMSMKPAIYGDKPEESNPTKE